MSRFKKYQEQCRTLEWSIRRMEEFSKSDLPKSAKEILKESLDKLKKISIAQPELEKVTGDFLDPAKVKELLEDATEYRWRVVPAKEAMENFGLDNEEYTPKEFAAANFGVEVKDEDVKLICFYRNTENRSELCRVDIVSIPGHFQCNWSNDRASTGDEVMPNSKFEKFIANIR